MSKKAPGGKRPRRRRPIDWKEARRLYEVDHLGVTEIARRIKCKRHTVASHRDREGWSRAAIGPEVAARAAEKVSERLVAEQGDQILATAKEIERQKAEALFVNGRLLAGLRQAVSPSDDGSAPTLLFDQGSDPGLLLRRVFLNLGTVKRGPGSDEDGGPEGASPHEEAVRRALDELEEK